MLIQQSIKRAWQIDKGSLSIVQVGLEHNKIHDGEHFFIADYLTTGFDLNDTLEFVLTTPNTTNWGHLTFMFNSSLGSTLEVFEGASSVVGGTAVTPLNNNRNSATASVISVVKDPSSITTGTRIAGFLAGGNRNAGFIMRENENILKQNTKYLFRFKSLVNSNSLGFIGEWYENIRQN